MKNSYHFWNILFWLNIAGTAYLLLYSTAYDDNRHSYLFLALTLLSLALSYFFKAQTKRIKKNEEQNQKDK